VVAKQSIMSGFSLDLLSRANTLQKKLKGPKMKFSQSESGSVLVSRFSYNYESIKF
jgi:hypothetical protein